MDPLNNAISFEDKKIAVGRSVYQSAVITSAKGDRFSERKTRQKLVEQPVFTERFQFHCEKSSGKASTVSDSELKSACIVIETRIEPLHS